VRHQRTLGRLLAAAALVAAAAGAGVPSPAAAAACPSAEGVTVVVDFNELGGGVPSVCEAAGGGKSASVLFEDAGFPLSYASQEPGFVCRVSGVPTSDPCVNTAPANAYWGLWWSDGKTGSWSYSSLGAPALTIPEGGYVAFSWDQSDGSAPPSFTPAAHRPEPTPSPTPTTKPSPSSRPTPTPGTSATPTPDGSPPASQPSVSTTTSAPPTPSASSASPSASASEGSPSPGGATSDVPTEPTEPTDEGAAEQYVRPDAAETEDDGLPPYVAPALIAALFAAAGVAFLVRRRPGSP
jgi:hypothetical protein